METPDKDAAKKLFDHYRKHREGISEAPELAKVCLICGSTQVFAREGDPHMLMCRSCGFAFYRYDCPACGETVDGRDPRHIGCRLCGLRVCSCGACGCPTG